VALKLSGPATLVGPGLVSLSGGVAAVWVRAGQRAGSVRLTAIHETLGTTEIQIAIATAAQEMV
jgi:beta-galactosidase